MTPSMAAGMVKLAGADAAALTDHNTTRNCPAFFRACEAYGLAPLAGMELTTAEDIHLICLLPDLDRAAAFERAAAAYRVLIRNKPQFFGHQYVMDENDQVLAEEEHLLPNATRLSLAEAFDLAQSHGGLCYPAHVDRESNGIIAVLGDFPAKPGFRHAEFRDGENIVPYGQRYPHLAGLTCLFGSDAHRPEDVPTEEFSLEVADSAFPAAALFERLKGECP